MPDIYLDPSQDLAVKTKVNSQQNVGYSISINDAKGKQLEIYSGNLGQNQDTAIIPLKSKAGKYGGCFINGIIDIADPNGEGNTYKINFSVVQNSSELTPIISMQGKTQDETVTRYPQFHINIPL